MSIQRSTQEASLLSLDDELLAHIARFVHLDDALFFVAYWCVYRNLTFGEKWIAPNLTTSN